MKKIKYFYNTQSLKYEKLVIPLRVKITRILGFISAALVTSLIIISIAYRFIESPREKILTQELNGMQQQYDALEGHMGSVKEELGALEKRDNGIYRAIFNAPPIPDSARAGEMVRQAEYLQLQNYSDEALVQSATVNLKEIEHRIKVQGKSYNQIDKLIANKQKMLACIPAIQPISNKDLSRISSGFGYRVDPIYKTVKFHPGLDFAAPTGTPIYATGDGIVEMAGFDDSGYGIHVIINHGYGYQTLYGHMVKVKVHQGDSVKRGEVIGWVGSTGKSTGSHCHYEVIRNGVKVDPVYYFYNDLTPQQYERMLKIASSGNQSMD
ncbi:MAG TPA: M23 family metallopeptidase [Chitinophagaceae bacterium]|nr:M23 family metallopeptidase [Chitinophagaceae bacterium]